MHRRSFRMYYFHQYGTDHYMKPNLNLARGTRTSTTDLYLLMTMLPCSLQKTLDADHKLLGCIASDSTTPSLQVPELRNEAIHEQRGLLHKCRSQILGSLEGWAKRTMCTPILLIGGTAHAVCDSSLSSSPPAILPKVFNGHPQTQ